LIKLEFRILYVFQTFAKTKKTQIPVIRKKLQQGNRYNLQILSWATVVGTAVLVEALREGTRGHGGAVGTLVVEVGI
jgi:hypothetical protein